MKKAMKTIGAWLAKVEEQHKKREAMGQEVTNFGRFFAAFNRLPHCGDRDGFKKQTVMQYTWNRTGSLHEMTRREYDDCCAALEELSGLKAEQKKLRSRVLNQMQKMGIDTSDWTRVDAFCQDRRIAGKVFRRLSNADLEKLSMKLRSIAHRGGLRPRSEEPAKAAKLYCVIPIDDHKATC